VDQHQPGYNDEVLSVRWIKYSVSL